MSVTFEWANAASDTEHDATPTRLYESVVWSSESLTWPSESVAWPSESLTWS